MFKRLRKSKKGSIPVISEILQIFLNVTPKPILFLIFILLISLIASFVVPLALQIFGYDCVKENGKLELYQVPMTKIVSLNFENYFNLKESVRGLFGLQDYRYPENPFPNGDKRYLKVDSKCIKTTNVINGSILSTTAISGYTGLCTNCSKSTPDLFGIFVVDPNQVCVSDGYFKTLTGGSLNAFAQFCYLCSPPNPYYFNISNCQSATDCYFTITNPALVSLIPDNYEETFYLDQVKKLGGVKKPQNSDEIVNIQCKATNTPALYFFSIEIFNPTMWTILLVGGGLIMVFWSYYKVVL